MSTHLTALVAATQTESRLEHAAQSRRARQLGRRRRRGRSSISRARREALRSLRDGIARTPREAR